MGQENRQYTMHTLGLTFVKEEQKNIEALNALNSNPALDEHNSDENWLDTQIRNHKNYFFAYIPGTVVRNLLDTFSCNEHRTEFEDCTDDVKEEFADLTEEEKEEYPSIHDYASEDYEIAYDENGNERYGYYFNPNSQFDYWSIGGNWEKCLRGKNGQKYTALPFDDVDWNNLFSELDYPYPLWYVDTNGEWQDADCFNEMDDWSKMFYSFIENMKSLPDEERKDIVVYTVDIHQ